MPFFDVQGLRAWFLREKRSFPWRDRPTPYAVWISEIMLQQTQAPVVIPYFERWMREFPTIEAVARAPLEKLVKCWEGLGYYSRVRNLHEGAKKVVAEYEGKLPDSPEKLAAIKGIGPYTRGAILSFAFHKKAAAVDGNVLRVLSRYFLIEKEIASARPQVQTLTEEILPEKEPWIVMEGLIELGAQICRKKPLCEECPLKGSCLGFLHKRAHLLPVKKKREKTVLLHRSVGVISHERKLLVGKVKGGGVMADLYEFPYVEVGGPGAAISYLKEALNKKFKLEVELERELPSVNHSFTRYHATLYPSHWIVESPEVVEGYEWVEIEKIALLPFSSGHRQILQKIIDAHIAH